MSITNSPALRQRWSERRTPVYRFPELHYEMRPESMVIDGSNRAVLLADRSGKSEVNVLANNAATGLGAVIPTGNNRGTGDFTISARIIVPPTAPLVSGTVCSASSTGANSTIANSLIFDWTANFSINIGLYAASSNFRYNAYTNIATAYAGQTILLTLTRAGGTWSLYLNGALVAPTTTNNTGGGAPPAFTDTVNTTFLQVGFVQSALASDCKTFFARMYSTALSAGEVLAEYDGAIQANNVVNCNFSVAGKLATSFVCATGQTVTINSAGDLGARICGARDAVQFTASKMAIYSGPAGGQPSAITYDGSNDYSKGSPFPLVQPAFVLLAGSQVTWTINDVFYDGITADSSKLYQRVTTPRLGMYAGTDAAANTDWSLATPAVHGGFWSGASGTSRLNRGTPVAVSTNTGSLNGFTLGAQGNGTAQFSNFNVQRILIYQGAQYDAIAQDRISRWAMSRHRVAA